MRLARAIGGGQKLGASKKTAQVDVGGAAPTMTKIDQGGIPETTTDFSDENALESEMETWNTRVEIAAEAMSRIDAIVNASYQNRYAAIEAEKTADEQARQQEINLAGGNAKKIKEINDKYDAREREREKEKRRLQYEQAKYQKNAAITTAIINTAMAVTAQLTLPVVGWVMAALALAAGIAEIAVISSQPLPSYAKGRKGGKAEIANINEQGQEAIVTRDGEAYLPQGNIAYLPEGSSVIPHHELIDYGGRSATLSGLPEWQSTQTLSIDALRGDITLLHRGLADVIKNKRENYLYVTDGGIKRMTKEGNTWSEWINDNVRL
jgi:hypothetical protein